MNHLQQINKIAHICAHKGVQNVIISPGSRSAPLTVAFARHPEICARVVYDERAAAYIAMGLAQQSGRAVGLVCTSGTAALNYAPAVVEAYYQQIPLLLFTADRPAEWIDQRDNQTIHQKGIYEPHCRASFELPVDTTPPDAEWHLERLICEAINKAMGAVPGPVHLNVPLREPLYAAADAPSADHSTAKLIESVPVQPRLSEHTWDALMSSWQAAKRKLIVVGMHAPDAQLRQALRLLSQDPTVAVIADITSNIYPDGSELHHSDMILGTRQESTQQQLVPDLLITLGGQMVSKYLKLWLRKKRPPIHWHIELAGEAVDTYQSLTHVIPVDASYFCDTLSQNTADRPPPPAPPPILGEGSTLSP
ncbi:MAG: 2-succinyl-5-enolpyruvyl-6-hydroxy-3-cyclohexene-1-carboxylic-acid synthase, partial [Ardenticatenaceae bacterium]